MVSEDDFKAILADDDKEFCRFHAVENKKSGRPDVHGFLLLDSLCPGKSDLVVGAKHGEIFLAVRPEELMASASFSRLVELRRCGLRYDEDTDSLTMLV